MEGLPVCLRYYYTLGSRLTQQGFMLRERELIVQQSGNVSELASQFVRAYVSVWHVSEGRKEETLIL